MRVSQLIHDQLDEITAEWAVEARHAMPNKQAAPPLRDHVRALLGDLAEWLERDGEREREVAGWEQAQRRAMDRFDNNCDFGIMADEYRLLRRVLLRRAVSAVTDLDRHEEIVRLDQAVDIVCAEAARRFARACGDLRDAEAGRARLAMEAAEIGTWEWFPRAGMLIWDDRCRQMFGLPNGPTDYRVFLVAVHRDDRARVDEQIKRNLQGEDAYQLEYRITRQNDGATRWVEGRGRVLARERDGYAQRFVGTVLDVTPRHEADEFRERFIGIVSHDLRNPLSVIAMGAKTILRHNHVPSEVATICARIESNVARMERIINDLLDMTRGRLGGGIPVVREPCNLDSIASGVVESLQGAHPDVRVTKDAAGCLDGRWDRERLAQVLDNLVANAIAHGDPAQPVGITLRGEGKEVTLEVHNSGAPIDPQLMPYLFDAFRRAGGGDHKGGGLGLGLYIAKEIVRAHGGRIAARSSAMDGTTFTVMLPR